MEESKLFQRGDLSVTTHRFVAGSQVFPIESIDHATAQVDNAVVSTVALAAIGLLMVYFGGIPIKLLGIAICAGAVYFQRLSRSANLIVEGDRRELYTCSFKGGGGALATEIAKAINQASLDSKLRSQATRNKELDEQADRLRNEVAALKSR